MPFYIRKSISAGPFRFNFSKGGVGVSVGVKGLRVGTGPRGHYVHAGRGGIYYRASLGRAGERPSADVPPMPQPFIPAAVQQGDVEMIEVESGDVLAMRDESFEELLDEINAKRQQIGLGILLGLTGAALGLLIASAVDPNSILIALVVAGVIGWAFGHWLDTYRRVCVLYYDLEPEVQQAYERATNCFDGLVNCDGKWHVEAGGAVRDITTWKRNAGASHIVRRNPTRLEYKLPRTVNSNITPPALHVGKQVIYFFPDVALVDDGGRVGAVGYSKLHIVWQDSNFIEEGVVPRDARIISHTWKHPNKNGGADRRFRDNYQIPVCRYESMHLRSSKGLNELLEFSRTGVAGPFAAALQALPMNKALQAAGALPHLV